MDARGDLALRVSGGLERLSGGSGWRGYLYTFTSSAPVGSRLAAHARPGPAGDLDIPERGGLAQLTHAAGGYLHTFIPPAPAESRLAAHARPGHGRRPGAAG